MSDQNASPDRDHPFCDDHRRILINVSREIGATVDEVIGDAFSEARSSVDGFDLLDVEAQDKELMRALGRVWRRCDNRRHAGRLAVQAVDRLRNRVAASESAGLKVISVKFLRRLIDEHDPLAVLGGGDV